MSKLTQTLMVALAVVVLGVASTHAAVIDGTNWADGVEAYSSSIQNYGGTLLSAETESWLTGAPDADADGNGYAWDAGDPDHVGGWRSNAPTEFIVMKWDTGIPDLPGDDLTICLYGGPSASANVLASMDGSSFTQIGVLGGGAAGDLRDETFDFAELFSEDVKFVRIERVGNGPQTGMFFDAFGGVVPEPATMSLLSLGAIGLLRRRSCR